MRKDVFINLLTSLDINEKELHELAKDTGFIQRTRKVDSLDLLHSLSIESIKGIASYNDIALSIENENGISISRQAIWKKATEPCVDYFKHVLELIILNKAGKYLNEIQVVKCKFKRVLIQDSTIIKLPGRLFSVFSGVSNGSTTVCNARIQGIYDLLSGSFVSFTINPYSKNDQASVSDMDIQKDDLTLRDRGYLTMDELRRHFILGAHCVYRYKIGMQLLDYKTKKAINILSLLKEQGAVDIWVRLNDREATPVRLVAIPVDQETANNRRMKAKREMKGHCPSEYFLQLQSWTIFITTISEDMADSNALLNIYGLRWRIEIIFKSWKSNLYFDNIHNVSKNQLMIILIARMIMFLIITQIIYPLCKRIISRHTKRELSLLKVTKYFTRNPLSLPLILVELLNYPSGKCNTIASISRHCVYEKRTRQNFEQKLGILEP
jgi:hypothetical protein